MTSGDPDRDEMHRLLSALCDDSATPEERQRLGALLRSSSRLWRFYLRYLDLHAAIQWHPDPDGALGRRPRGPQAAPPRGRHLLWAGCGALAMLVAAVVFGWIGPGPHGLSPLAGSLSPLGESVAVFTGGQCRWGTPPDLQPGCRLAVGEYELLEGVAGILLDAGVELAIEAPARFRLDGRRDLTVSSGRILFQADGSTESVRVRTPRSEYVNLGTRYVMAVRDEADELHVLEGEVRRMASHGQETTEITAAGKARRYLSDRAPGIQIPLDRSAPTLFSPVSGRDDLSAYDRFDYRGPKAGGMDRAGGEGWFSPWVFHEGLVPIEFDAGHSLAWPDEPAATGAGILSHRGGRGAMHRELASALRLDRDAVYYLSYRCVRAPAAGDDVNQVQLVFRKRGLTAEQEIAQGTSLKFAIARRSSFAAVTLGRETTRTSIPIVADTTHMVVGKVVASRDRPDQAFLRVYRPDDPPSDREPAEWSVVSPALNLDTTFDQVSIEFFSEGEIRLDDLRIGTTWGSVTRPGVFTTEVGGGGGKGAPVAPAAR